MYTCVFSDKVGNSQRNKALYRCPMEGCYKVLRTLSGLKNHQACHTVTQSLTDARQTSEKTPWESETSSHPARNSECRSSSNRETALLFDSKTPLTSTANSKRRNSDAAKLASSGRMKHQVYREVNLPQITAAAAARPRSVEVTPNLSRLEHHVSIRHQSSSPTGLKSVPGGGGSFVCIFCGMLLGSQVEVAEHVQQQHHNLVRQPLDQLNPFACTPPCSSMMLYGASAAAAAAAAVASASVPTHLAGRTPNIDSDGNHSSAIGKLNLLGTGVDMDTMTWASGGGGDKYLTCDFPGCCKSFRELKHLKVHKMQHTDERPLKCLQCDYSCRQRNSMNWHMKSKHGKEKMVDSDGRTVYV